MQQIIQPVVGDTVVMQHSENVQDIAEGVVKVELKLMQVEWLQRFVNSRIGYLP